MALMLLCTKKQITDNAETYKYTIFRAQFSSFCSKHHECQFIVKLDMLVENYHMFISKKFQKFFKSFTIFQIF